MQSRVLIIGAPYFNASGDERAGAIYVLVARPGRGFVENDDNVRLSQDSPNIGGGTEPQDWFGWSVAVGRFTGAGSPDVIVGVPYEDIGTLVDAGAVLIIHGASEGLNGLDSRSFTQGSLQFPGEVSAYARFGWALVVEDFDGDRLQDLAVSAVTRYGVGPLDSVSVLYQQPYIPVTIIDDGFE